MKNPFPYLWYGMIFFACSPSPYPDPLSPEEALAAFELADGFTIELFAAEPHVQDPVSMIFDERGNIYVVEMPDYPDKPEPGQAKGRIRRLVDTDGDGTIDTSTVFADQLSEATSMLPWKGGLLVTSAPHIYYLRDTNGDHRADQEEILFSGFFENNSEAQITNLRFSVDNWIYAANFGQPGEVIYHRRPEADTLPMRGGDFRFRLDRDQFELATGPTQFGQAINDRGHRFMSQNTIHLRQAVIPWRYLHRHAYLPSGNGVQNISDHDLEMFQLTPPPYWRAERTRRRQKSYDEQQLDRTEYAEDHFTGASGATFYGGDAYPAEFYGNIFSGDVSGNLIHRDVLSLPGDSPVYVARRSETEMDREFLASRDPWFRPANFTVGPDGCLYVIDMHRQHIETPVSIPEDLKADMDFYNGSQHGRIYRIVPKNNPRPVIRPNLAEKTSTELVELLTHANQWHRLTAQRLLLERQDTSAGAQLKDLFKENADPRSRLHALYTLEGLGLLQETMVQAALTDPDPGLREHGIILSEKYSKFIPQMAKLVTDADPRVALQAALSLGVFSGPEVTSALADVMEQHGEDPWFRTAVLSSSAGSSPELLEQLISRQYFSDPLDAAQTDFLQDLAKIIRKRDHPGELDRLAAQLQTIPRDSTLDRIIQETLQ
ncbi:PVC-type heme-binding CxxCH protein [Flavilitoribacter nigricans]|uniref:Dehydrogenase n=1 Tax=Flavilitoribacter nigricans (strain ATCC 23147 / DSM 23189 / NBRC 102662 / NCIMB 1420 / SS-2) TaxID=1122177 RepID=A0A2D0N1V5_FLAN2|nr:PVC-type heme-binding CxxCH protein [Flavilitoribacter nigricans]PHN02368.1 dehydrogenase [Flavilitoribacter nigricans DSM 23189 = NBRC 102662]